MINRVEVEEVRIDFGRETEKLFDLTFRKGERTDKTQRRFKLSTIDWGNEIFRDYL